MVDDAQSNAIDLATELTIAWLGNPNNRAAADDVPAFLRTMHSTVIELANGVTPAIPSEFTQAVEPEHVPAVTVRKSLASKDHILSMIDGKPYKALRRHLNTHGMTPEQYRARYNLKPDYPMVAEAYSEARREMAKKIGLGSKGRQARAAATSAPSETEKPAPRKRTKAGD